MKIITFQLEMVVNEFSKEFNCDLGIFKGVCHELYRIANILRANFKGFFP